MADQISIPLVSVLMPAFNAEKHIAQAIDSILQQSFTNFELIVFNDGSTDRTKLIVDTFADNRIIKMNLDQNKGLVNARNQLVTAAQGKYIAFLDADDVALPHRLQLQVQFLDSGKADICGGTYDALYEANGKVKLSKQRYSDADIRALISICSPLCNPAVMGKAEVFKSHPYQAGKDYAEDYSLWAELALSGFRFANLREKLITYRIHPGQTSQVQNAAINKVFNKSREEYLLGLGIASDLNPKSMPFSNRLTLGIPFMVKLNEQITGVSVLANYEIYSRFQFRGNGLLTPFTRLERLLVAVFASLKGHI